MTRFWRNLFRDNPMQIEALRAARRFTSTSGRNDALRRNLARTILTLLCLMYVWMLGMIVKYREDVSQELFWFEFLLLTLMVPGSLYAAISGERERLTWDSLILTRLSPARILIGKLTWRLLMVVAIMALFSVPIFLSHMMARLNTEYTLPNLIWTQACLGTWSVLLATFTLWVSARTKRSVTTLAIVLGWLVAFLALIPTLVSLFGGEAQSLLNGNPKSWEHVPEVVPPIIHVGAILVYLNPAFAISSLAKLGQVNTPSEVSNVLIFWRGIQMASPLIYLTTAGVCILATLRELARLGLPTGGRR